MGMLKDEMSKIKLVGNVYKSGKVFFLDITNL